MCGRRLVRRVPGEDEGDPVARPHREGGPGRQVVAVDGDTAHELEGVRTGDERERAVEPADPGHRRPVVEADDQIQRHRHGAAHALHHPHQVGSRPAYRHAVREADAAFVAVEGRLEDERAGPVAPLDPQAAAARAVGRRRRDLPASVRAIAEQRGEARTRVEAGQAQPVDRAVAPDERGRLGVSDERVVLDPHAAYPAPGRWPGSAGNALGRGAPATRAPIRVRPGPSCAAVLTLPVHPPGNVPSAGTRRRSGAAAGRSGRAASRSGAGRSSGGPPGDPGRRRSRLRRRGASS